MSKTILITGASDGIGLDTAKVLLAEGHTVLLHGRSQAKLDAIATDLAQYKNQAHYYLADLSNFVDVSKLAITVSNDHKQLDVLINNAGILKTPNTITQYGIDVRFVVNTLAPYHLTQLLLPKLAHDGRIINLSSAAQAPVDLQAMASGTPMSDMEAYAQSKLAITMWTKTLAAQLANASDQSVVAVNPGSLLGTKMVKEGFGTSGKDIGIGSSILRRAALDKDFGKAASGQYFDNDSQRFASPHPDALSASTTRTTVEAVETLVKSLAG